MQDDNQIVLKKGAHTTLSFVGKSTAGYEWTVEADGDNCLKIEKQVQEQKISRLGQSSNENFILTAMSTGTAILHFSLSRSWEKSTEPLKRIIYQVKVE